MPSPALPARRDQTYQRSNARPYTSEHRQISGMRFSAARSRNHDRLYREASAQPYQGAEEHWMTTRPTALPCRLLTYRRWNRRQPELFAIDTLPHASSRKLNCGVLNVPSRSSLVGLVWANPHIGIINTKISSATGILCISSPSMQSNAWKYSEAAQIDPEMVKPDCGKTTSAFVLYGSYSCYQNSPLTESLCSCNHQWLTFWESQMESGSTPHR